MSYEDAKISDAINPKPDQLDKDMRQMTIWIGGIVVALVIGMIVINFQYWPK